MNWYKLAQKIQESIQYRGLQPQDLISFYATQSLTDETLREYPNLFYDFIEQINAIREYYLNFLIPRIMRELGHAIDECEALESGEIDYEIYSFGEYLGDFNIDTEDEDYDEDDILEQYMDYMSENNIRQEGVIAYADETDIIELREKTHLSNADFVRVIELFEDLDWSHNYGGESWAQITIWTQKLYHVPPLNVHNNPNTVLLHARNLVYIIDVINSLHHNNALVLGDLPNREGYWFSGILEFVKHIPSVLGLSYFSKNPELMRAARSEARFFLADSQNIKEILYNMLLNMNDFDRYSFLTSVNYPPIIDIFLEFDEDLIKYLIFNPSPHVKQYTLGIFMRLVAKQGLEKTLSGLPFIIGKINNLSQEMMEQIHKAYKTIQPNSPLNVGEK